LRINRLLSRIGLPEKIKGISLPKLLKAMQHDKKFKGAQNRFVLITGIGQSKVVEGVPEGIVRSAIKKYM